MLLTSGELGNDAAAHSRDMAGHSIALRFQPEATRALLVGAYAVIGDKPGCPESAPVARSGLYEPF